jgi:ribonuclease BN (tRNA processing enzyme)
VTAIGPAVTVLGADGSYPGPGGACSGYLVTAGGTSVWLDAGSGTLANLQRHASLAAVDAVVLSHAHPDHWTDIEGFYVACRYFLRRRGVPVYCPAGLRPLARGVDDDGTLAWAEVKDGSEVAVGPLFLRFARTDHPVETLAVRVEAGGSALAYSADTGPGWDLSVLGRAELALVEASFLSDHEGRVQHLSARQAGVTARRAGAGRLVITHIGPGVDKAAAQLEASASFGEPVDVAVVGARYLL